MDADNVQDARLERAAATAHARLIDMTLNYRRLSEGTISRTDFIESVWSAIKAGEELLAAEGNDVIDPYRELIDAKTAASH